MNSDVHEYSSFKDCPMISSSDLHELFMKIILEVLMNIHD